MIRMHGRILKAVTVLTMTALTLTGCTSEASSISSAKGKADDADMIDTGFTMSTVGSFDSADTAVVLSIDETNKAVTLINMETGKQYTLYYDGTTYVKDKHDGPMTISQMKAGDVVDVTFLKGKKRLASIKRSPEAWVYDDVYNYDLAGANRTASIGSQTYSMPEGVVVLSEGRRVDSAEVVSQDVVTISGINHEIYSVSVDKGHGYLRLKNDQPLLGGWIEVGNSVIRQITEDMLLVVPEGTYQVALSNKNVSCIKEVTVERDKEVVLDVSDLEIAEDAVGKILFTVTPENATVSVDNKPVDISKVVELPYGIHRVEASASGYDTLTKHIQVGSEYATIAFTLEEARKESSERDTVSVNSVPKEEKEPFEYEDTYKPVDSISANSVPKSVSENALGTSNNNKVYIDSPKGVEVYLDGNYKGLSPVKFDKVAGRHEITLRRDGYESKTYSIYLENDKKDEAFSFSELEKITIVGRQVPSEIISAVSGIANCTLKEGTDVNFDRERKIATLTGSGKNAIVTAVQKAVQMKIGEVETGKYSFTVTQDNLSNVTAPQTAEDGSITNGSGTVSISIYRSGYKEQNVSFGVAIEGKETTAPEKKIAVVVAADKDEVEAGGSVRFTADVKDNGTAVPDAKVSWKVEGEDTGISDTELTVSVKEDETRESLTVAATYTDNDGDSFASDPKTVSIKKKPETPPDPDEGEDGDGEGDDNGDDTGDTGNNTGGDTDTSGGDTDNNNGGDTGNSGGDTGNNNGGDTGNNNGGDTGNSGGDTGNNNGGDTGNNNGDDTGNNNGGDTDNNNSGSEGEVTVNMNQQAHPIRNFFSSLFK